MRLWVEMFLNNPAALADFRDWVVVESATLTKEVDALVEEGDSRKAAVRVGQKRGIRKVLAQMDQKLKEERDQDVIRKKAGAR